MLFFSVVSSSFFAPLLTLIVLCFLLFSQNINAAPFTLESRTPDPNRMLQAYHSSAAASNLLRAFSDGGYGDLKRVKEWGMDWSLSTSRGRQYMATAERIADALSFMDTCGISREQPGVTSTRVYTSHEALLLPYEQALTRIDQCTGKHYACSGHFLWIGERTRGLQDAHIEFARGIANRKYTSVCILFFCGSFFSPTSSNHISMCIHLHLHLSQLLALKLVPVWIPKSCFVSVTS